MNIFINEKFAALYQEYPLVLVDIGAAGGLPRHWECAQEHLSVIGFEPDAKEFERLNRSSNGKRVYLNAALSNKKMTSDFYITRKQQASSMLEPNVEFLKKFPDAGRFDIVQRAQIAVDTLDNQLKTNRINNVDFIKIDAQGAELSILEGAAATLGQPVFGCEIEVEFAPLYKDQPRFAEIDQYVRKFDFQLIDLQSFRWKRQKGKDLGRGKGQIVFANALYLRDLAPYMKSIQSIPEVDTRKSKVLKAMSICFAYGYFDYAYELFEASENLFSDEDKKIIEHRIKSGYIHGKLWDSIKYALNLDGFYDQLRRTVKKDWASCDRRIGNL